MFSETTQKHLGLLFILAGFLYAIGPLFRDLGSNEILRHIDARATYISGVCWLSGQSPYHPETFQQTWNTLMVNEMLQNQIELGRVALPYPPTLGLISIPLSLFSWETAQTLVDLLNVFLLGLIALFTLLLLKDYQRNFLILSFGIGVSLFSQLPYTTAVLVVGQNSLMATTGCLGAIYFARRQQFWIATVFVLLASIKPHLSLLPLLYLFITTKDWRFFGGATVAVGVTSFGILTLGGDLNPLPDILRSVAYYQTNFANSTALLPGFNFILGKLNVAPHIIGLLPVMGILLVIFLAVWGRQREMTDYQHLLLISLTICLTAMFMPLHHYDYTLFFLITSLLVISKGYSVFWLLPGILLIAAPGTVARWINGSFGGAYTDSIVIGSVVGIYLAIVIAGMVGQDLNRRSPKQVLDSNLN